VKIVPLEKSHWPEVRKIYQDGIDTNQATFETIAPKWEAWDKGHLKIARLVTLQNNNVIGWSALSPVSTRIVYQGVAEVSLYIALDQRREGLGKMLMEQLIDISEKEGIWTLQSSLFPENQESISLHEKFGFRKVGTREKIARHHGIWRDTVIYERRSKSPNFK
jgi:phosphinothricin acetyltransferase